MKRAGIFLFYDPEGKVDDYILGCLGSLQQHMDYLLVVSNSPLDETNRKRLESVSSEVMERKNVGYDVGAYRDGLRHLGWDHMGDYDELVLFNYTFFAPIHPWAGLFERTDKWDTDFWGITEHDEVRPHPFLPKLVMPRHIQSHWIAVRSSLSTTKDWRTYWEDMPPIESYNDSIQWHESRFTGYFNALGYRHEVAYNVDDYPSANPVFDNATLLLQDGCPILKRRNLFHNPLHLDRFAIIGADMLEQARAAGYDTDLILSNLARTSKPRDLVTNAGLTWVVPQSASEETYAAAATQKILAVAHIFYADMAEEILQRLSVLPKGYYLVATTSNEENQAQIRAVMERYGVEGEVRVVASNRGRDIGAFLVDCNDVLASGKWDIVVKIHSKKSVQDDYNAAQLFKTHLYDNLLNSRAHVANILAEFAAHPALGMVLAPLPHMGYPTMGHAWFTNREPAQAVAKRLGINVPFDKDMPLATYGSMFIARPQALAKLVNAGFKPENFPVEGGYKDGSLAHVLERLMAYAALSEGFYVRPVLAPKWAEVYYGYLEYKLAAVSSFLPPFTIDQVPYLKAHGGPIPNVLASIKVNIMLRQPKVGNALKPAYRLVRKGAATVRKLHRH
ncbi:MAG: rhamnan synthesis protein F [Actinomyces graevenitzii]|uniref:Rhamnan synthesis F family protein n=1 Tax=Actinomyces graevenitzii TaxID=55565 RepID=A0A9E7AMW3_9ACTO|nr:rhamnan synthesis protein F [Actinomyces graevenitzii]MBS5244916.1 rhamnan synthesis protein F [Actinomyces graevenitzii]UQF80182.1 MAG: rhamnan synthesis F family protein [Actinomyces graevenitzii]